MSLFDFTSSQDINNTDPERSNYVGKPGRRRFKLWTTFV